jgi:hypothetical protein
MYSLSYVLAGTLAVGGLVFMGCDDRRTVSNDRAANPDDARTVAEKDGPMERAGEKVDRAVDRATDRLMPTKPTGEVKELAPDYEDIRGVLAKVTEAAFTTNSVDDLAGYFVDFDRNRVKEFVSDEKNFADLNAKIERLRNSWKAKYGHDFGIEKKDLVFAEDKVWIVQAEIGDSAKLASGKLTGPNAQLRADIDRRISSGASESRTTGMDKPGTPEAQKNLNDPGRNIALVTFAAADGMKQFELPFIHEMPDSWRIDVPDAMDGTRLRDSLSRHLSMIEDSVDKWPAAENDAYRLVSYHVLMAVMDAKGDMK